MLGFAVRLPARRHIEDALDGETSLFANPLYAFQPLAIRAQSIQEHIGDLPGALDEFMDTGKRYPWLKWQ